MGKETNIQWCDSTVNPTTGCDGCELWHPTAKGSCYAGNYHETRMAKAIPSLYATDFTEVRLAPGRMAKAAGFSDLRGTDRPDKPWLNGMPRVIFVGDMGDVFSKSVPFDYLKSEVIDNATSPKGSRHIWMLLTKRPGTMALFADWLKGKHDLDWPVNLWSGTSITDHKSSSRIDRLLKVPAFVRFLSVEPMLGPIDLRLKPNDTGDFYRDLDARVRRRSLDRLTGIKSITSDDIHWVICGGESGPNARPFDLDWARSIRDQCKAAGVPCFVKQMGSRPVEVQPDSNGFRQAFSVELKDSHGGDWSEWPEDLRVREFPKTEASHV